MDLVIPLTMGSGSSWEGGTSDLGGCCALDVTEGHKEALETWERPE